MPPIELINAIRRLGRTLSVRPQQMLVIHGAKDREVYFIERGEFEVVQIARDGQPVVIRDLGAGSVFGDLAALIDEPRSASVIARSAGQVVAISDQQFLHTVASDFQASSWFMKRLGREVRRLTDKVFELTALSARDRLHCELLRLCVGIDARDGQVLIERPPTHEMIALRIGSQREAVSREMSRLVTQEIVKKTGRDWLVDFERLSAKVDVEVGTHSADR